jgi:hypothetical protein
MMRQVCFHLLALVILGGLILAGGCQKESQPPPENMTPPQPQSQHPTPAAFAITYPTSNSTVDRDIITVRGEGALPGTTVDIDVFTDSWYPQNGAAQINKDGTWAYSPCYLKGQGSFRLHHNIRARLMRDNQQVESVTVYDVAVK